ncbi:MAG: hypothetical protein JOZ48_04925 [Acidobacteriaceae bacterium]|nr:hypothetical protein [Acidobacteriaceae bacterium]
MVRPRPWPGDHVMQRLHHVEQRLIDSEKLVGMQRPMQVRDIHHLAEHIRGVDLHRIMIIDTNLRKCLLKVTVGLQFANDPDELTSNRRHVKSAWASPSAAVRPVRTADSCLSQLVNTRNQMRKKLLRPSGPPIGWCVAPRVIV